MRQKSTLFAGLIVATALLSAPLAVNAFTIDSSTATHQTFDVSWELMGTDSANPTGQDLSGMATFEYLGISANGTEMLFGLTLTNTSSPTMTSASSAVLTAFGFGNDANFQLASWGSTASGGIDSTSDNGSGNGDITGLVGEGIYGSLPAGTPTLDIAIEEDASGECIKDPNNSAPDACVTLVAVAGGDGLAAGTTDSFQFALTLDQAVSTTIPTVTIDPFAVAYATNTESSSTLRVAAAAQVPSPGTLALIGAGVLLMRRKFGQR